jgi:AcrR family transcriptional regulator
MSSQLRKQEYKDQLREVMLEAARNLVIDEGYEGFSLRKLAMKIECSPGNIYLYFKNKEELFYCLVEDSFAHLLKALEKLRDSEETDPVMLLKECLRTYVEFGLSHPNDYRVAFLLQQPIDKPPSTPHAAFDVLRHLVRQCIEQANLPAADVDTTSQALWSAAHGVTSLLIQRPSFPWVDKDKLTAQVINSAVNSLALWEIQNR